MYVYILTDEHENVIRVFGDVEDSDTITSFILSYNPAFVRCDPVTFSQLPHYETNDNVFIGAWDVWYSDGSTCHWHLIASKVY